MQKVIDFIKCYYGEELFDIVMDHGGIFVISEEDEQLMITMITCKDELSKRKNKYEEFAKNNETCIVCYPTSREGDYVDIKIAKLNSTNFDTVYNEIYSSISEEAIKAQ
jgi:hypothetical protein